METEGLHEVLEGPAPLALVPPGPAQLEAGLGAGPGVGEEVKDAVEVRHGIFQFRGAAGLPPLQDAPQEQPVGGFRGLDVFAAEAIQVGHGRLGLPLDVHLVLGEPEQDLRSELTLRAGLEQLAPGVESLLVGL